MTFKQKSLDFFSDQILLGFSIVEFDMIGEINLDGKNIIHEFINSPNDFETARKYIGGYPCDHTNKFGQRKIFKNYDFGPFPIDLLEHQDYKPITVKDFEVKIFKYLSEYDKTELKRIEFVSKTKYAFKNLEAKSHNFYQLIPEEWKFNDIGAFELEDYFCAFSIDRIENTFTVVQLAVD